MKRSIKCALGLLDSDSLLVPYFYLSYESIWALDDPDHMRVLFRTSFAIQLRERNQESNLKIQIRGKIA